MSNLQVPALTHIGYAHFYTADIQRALHFYGEQLGFQIVRQEGDATVLSADGMTPHILLTERQGWPPKPARSTGLYHVAIRLPDRRQLARVFRRLLTFRYPFGGFSDHAVSEALYLNDPDGNGLELYRDRPRADWPRLGDQIQMTTHPLDLENLLADADDSPWDGIHPATDIGHVHLHVADLDRAKTFYVDVVGLDVVADWSGHGALFVAAGGYHHHIGLNIWAGNQPQPARTLGLRSFTLQLPDVAAREAVAARLAEAGVTAAMQSDHSLMVHDPDGNAIELMVDAVEA
jgi:catechol 2,3-dioxygenase